MTDGVFPDRLNQLRARWEADPASRIFLQLAEEYRHLGRVQEALAVLDKGLSEHPGYLSALVAKGRCHLELADGDAARVVLERVVKQDATQMVANKLLVRAYLETGDPAKAQERLDLYSLLNDSDPEIEELRRRIRLLEKPVRQEVPSLDAHPPAAPVPEPADVFDLGLPPVAPPPAAADDLFAALPVFPRMAVPPPVAPSPEPSAAEPAEEGEPDLIFPGLGAGDSRHRYLAALEAEGLFAFEPASAVAVVVPVEEPVAAPGVPEPASEEASWLDEAAVAAPSSTQAPVLAPLSPAIFAPEPFEAPVPAAASAEELWAEEEEAPPAPAAAEWVAEPVVELQAEPVVELETVPEPEPVFEPAPEAMPEVEAAPEPEPVAALGVEAITATATLGELYFRQGYYSEAERIFREVLGHEPGNLVALTGLERLAALGSQPAARGLDARRLLSGYRRDAVQPVDAELRARKTYLLNRYLERLRQGSPLDVS
ncbi:MAG TPA: hypothetical protein DD490_10725 [Acidobacteria bacterium]|nr:hypothetical protein [Acidobacteriota bacterium]